MRLKNVGSIGWRGQDFDGTSLFARPGEEIEMTQERADGLLRDFPGMFAVAKPEVEPGAVRPSPVAPPRPRRRKSR